jgi:hypothetical protein
MYTEIDIENDNTLLLDDLNVMIVRFGSGLTKLTNKHSRI